MAKLYFMHGSMGASKSAQLLMNAHSFEERGVSFLCMKPSVDTRDGIGIIKSRIGIERPCISIGEDDDLYKIIETTAMEMQLRLIDRLQWILVDESQFLKAEQVEQLAHVVDRMGINVICYGLRTDFQTKLFEGSMRLMELADDIEEMKISCSCGRKAIINARIDANGHITDDGEQIMIGGDDSYVPLCRKCYYEALEKKRERMSNINDNEIETDETSD